MADEWLSAARQRLVQAGFEVQDGVAWEGRQFSTVARRGRFEVTKFGFVETFFVFGEFDALDLATMRGFSSDAYRYAKRNRKCFLPCGLFASVTAFPVAAARRVDPATEAAVRNETPPKHWSAAEVPVVYDRSSARLFYFERTPMWGAAYWKGFRAQITGLLGGQA